jgi:histidyl-tRNA synthetase
LEGKGKLSTANYKGTRDFYPEDMDFRNWMFSVMKQVVVSYGYREYDAPVLESFDLYKAKTGEEIVQKQLYDFVDKGERHVAIRPEMTPSLARMVAAKTRELAKPIRWFSIPNLWRYETPGHGRLREHWQLNVDIFGVNTYLAEVEIIDLACNILYAYNAPKDSFTVKISHRQLLNDFFQNTLKLDINQSQPLAKLLDKKNKITKADFESGVREILPDSEKQIPLLYQYLDSTLETLSAIEGISPTRISEIQSLFSALGKLALKDQIEFDPSIIRGFDYYTGYIFEIFDTDPNNRRSLYGGGRYDNLIGLFSNDELSGIGFGLGDVTLENFLRTHKLVPNFSRANTVYIPLLDQKYFTEVMQLAKLLRQNGLSVEVSLDGNIKLGKQFAAAEKKGSRYLLILGEDEISQNIINLKDLQTGNQTSISKDSICSLLLEKIGKEQV